MTKNNISNIKVIQDITQKLADFSLTNIEMVKKGKVRCKGTLKPEESASIFYFLMVGKWWRGWEGDL